MGVAPDAIEYLWDRLHELEPDSKLGGICALKPGYHASRKENKANWPHDYSIQDSEDQGGDDDWCAAIDWTFPDAQAGHYATINKYSKRLMASGEDVDDDRLNNIREFFGNTDADVTTEGWDYRYAVKSTSADKTHAWHIHISFDREWANDRPTMDRLIAVLQGDDMALSDSDIEKIAKKVWTLDNVKESPDAPKPPHEDPDYGDPDNPNDGNKHWAAKSYLRRTYESADQGLANDEVTAAKLAEIEAAVNEIRNLLKVTGGGTFNASGMITLTPETGGVG
jgi:hypothetical protein